MATWPLRDQKRLLAVLTAAAALGVALAIGCPSSQSSLTAPTAPGELTAPTQPPVLVGAGDIADCSDGAAGTARLLDATPGTVFTVGDNAYHGASLDVFEKCYGPSWGRHRSRTRPTPGNHDYESPGAAGYFDYFGESAGPRGLGYYSYRVESWRVLALNSELSLGPGSAQLDWVDAVLTRDPATCAVAYWHRPRFGSGPRGDSADLDALWRLLYDRGVDVVINGHEHFYERSGRQTPDGVLDDARGIRQFVVGTGGAELYERILVRPAAEFFSSSRGVLAVTLSGGGYEWRFVEAPSGATLDQGVDRCH